AFGTGIPGKSFQNVKLASGSLGSGELWKVLRPAIAAQKLTKFPLEEIWVIALAICSEFSGSTKIPARASSTILRACPSTPNITGRAQDINSSILVGITVLKTPLFFSVTRQASEAQM